MASNRTKKAKIVKNIFTVLHILCLLGPFLYFLPFAFITGAVISKIAISFSVIIALIIAAISVIVDVKHREGLHRSMMWILILGVLFCLNKVKFFIWIMGFTSLADELIFTRVKNHYATVAATNKEIDRALNR